MTTIQQAIEAAAKETMDCLYAVNLDRDHAARIALNITSRYVLPAVERVDKIIAESLRELPVGYMPAHKPESIPGRIAELVRRYAETDRLEDERDTALAKLAEARGLLTEIWDNLPDPQARDDILGHDVVDRVDAFLSPSTQTTDKP